MEERKEGEGEREVGEWKRGKGGHGDHKETLVPKLVYLPSFAQQLLVSILSTGKRKKSCILPCEGSD